MTDRRDQSFGNYRLTQRLGSGGFAEVYLGRHIHLGSEAAIKLLHAQFATAGELEQFRTEAQTIASLHHPHIVRLLDFGVEEGTPYLVVDYAPHGSLRQRFPLGTRLSPATILPMLLQVASALQYAHAQQVVHRDVKPENLLLGRSQEVLLTDFGIATVAQNTSQQRTQGVAGTAAYMAPEQLQGKPRPASDLYALGIIVYEWLCGERPFQGGPLEVATQHLLTPPPPLREKVPSIAPAVEQVVLIALAKDPKERFGSVRAFATAFAQAADAPELLSTLFTHLADPAAPADQPEVPLSSQGGSAIFSATTHITPQVTPQLSNPSLPTAPAQPAAAWQAAAFGVPPALDEPEILPSGGQPPTAQKIPPAAPGRATPPPGDRWPQEPAAVRPAFEAASSSGGQAKQRDEAPLGPVPLGLGAPAPGGRGGRREGGVPRWVLAAVAALVLVALLGGGIDWGMSQLHTGSAAATAGGVAVGVTTTTATAPSTAGLTPTATAAPTQQQPTAPTQQQPTASPTQRQPTASPTPQPPSPTALYRLRNPSNGHHFYTISASERDNAIAQYGYLSEGIGAYVFASQIAGSTPLYRLYQPTYAIFFYTISASERDNAIAQYGYQSNGIAAYVFASQVAGTIPLYRLYNPKTGDFFYTASASERDSAIAQNGYQSNGIACYVE